MGPYAASVRALALALILAAFPTLAADNYSDIWWNPRESGWGLTIADHETTLWAIWFTYRQNGAPTWMYVPGGTFSNDKRNFTGDIYQTTGPSYRTAYGSRPITNVKVGTARFDFAPAGFAPGIAMFNYTVGDVTGGRQIERFGFGNAAPNWGNDFTEVWWDPAESGWGITLAQHGSTIFGVWYTYGDDGLPLFVVLPSGTLTATDTIRGDLITTTGPWFGNATFDSAQVTQVAFGTLEATIEMRTAIPPTAFRPMKGSWRPRHVDGTTFSKFFTQLGFGNAAPGTAPPACLSAGTCVERASSGDFCSYRACTAGTPDMYDSYGYGYRGTPCACSPETNNLNVPCTSTRPLVAIGQSCAAGQGCAVGSVCATLTNGAKVCMAEAEFARTMCY